MLANRELGGWTSEPYNSEGSAISFFTSDMSRIKFSGCVIRDNAQYFNSTSDPSTDTGNNVTEGDVWIKSNEGYIYVSADTISKHSKIGYKDISLSENLDAFDGGKWIKACRWWQRSPYADSSNYFVGVYSYGSPYYSYIGTYNNLGIVYGFSI